MLVIAPTNRRALPHSSQMRLDSGGSDVRPLQGRISSAAAQEEHAQVNLTKLLVRSMATTRKAGRQVTREQNGKPTPGMDGWVRYGPEAPGAVQEGLRLAGYPPSR